MKNNATVKGSREDQRFYSLWRRFQNSTPKTYRKISFDLCGLLFGPEIPDTAFVDLKTLRDWYRAVLLAWLGDSLKVADLWGDRLPSQENELALSRLVLEARNNGVRRIQRRLLRDSDGVPRDLPINSYSELSFWCDFMFELLNDEEQHVAHQREKLTIRYDQGVAFRLEEKRKDLHEKQDEWVAGMAHSFMKALCKGEPKTIEPDDDWLLVVWGGVACETSVREAAVSMFIDAEEQPKKPNTQMLEDMVSATWKAMRDLGPVCCEEPQDTSPKQVRKHLDVVKRFCEQQKPKDRIHSGSKVEVAEQSANQHRFMDDQFQYDVFLSHSSKDKAVVRLLAERLRQDGVKVWFDEWELKPGDSIPAKIEEGLEHSRVLVLSMSANAFSSDWAQLEAGTFRFRDPLNKERRFIPLRLDDAPIKGSLAQFFYINWRTEEREQEYAKLLATCRGEINLSSTCKPSHITQVRADSDVPTKFVQILHSGSGDIVMGNKTVSRQATTFTPGPQHITPETSRKLSNLVKEIVERLTVSSGNVPKAFQRVWGDFNRHFGLTTYKELPREKADEAINYLRQWRASKNSRLRFADPEMFRIAQLKGIWPRSKSLGYTDGDLYAFASKKLRLTPPITSLKDLGNQQLDRLNRFLIYEERKRKRVLGI